MPRARVKDDQPSIDGMEDEKNPKVHKAALRYVRERNARMAANEEEKAAHDTLLEVMEAEGLESYRYGGLSVNIDKTRKCKVKAESHDKE